MSPGQKRWRSICRFLLLALIAFNTLTLSQDITGDGPEVRFGYIIALILFPWVWFVGKTSWRKPFTRRLDRRVAYLILLLLVSSASAVQYFQFSGLPRTFFLSWGVILLYGGTAVAILRAFDIEEVISLYIVVAKWASVVALFQLFIWAVLHRDTTVWIQSLGVVSRFGGEQGRLIRVNAWWQEPADLAAFLSLAVFLCIIPGPASLDKRLQISPAWRLVIVAAFALTFAASALATFPFIVLAYAPRWRRSWVILPLAVLGIYWVSNSPLIMERLLALVALDGGRVSNNLSVWALQSNYYVSLDSLRYAPLGLGVGTHLNSYLNWISHWGIYKFDDAVAFLLNARDGGSMPIRLLSELGWPSVLIWIFLIYRSVKLAFSGLIFKSQAGYIEFIGLAAFLTLCARQGSYSMFDPWLMLLIPLSF